MFYNIEHKITRSIELEWHVYTLKKRRRKKNCKNKSIIPRILENPFTRVIKFSLTILDTPGSRFFNYPTTSRYNPLNGSQTFRKKSVHPTQFASIDRCLVFRSSTRSRHFSSFSSPYFLFFSFQMLDPLPIKFPIIRPVILQSLLRPYIYIPLRAWSDWN